MRISLSLTLFLAVSIQLVSGQDAKRDVAQEEVLLFNDSIQLPGTLSIPAGVKNPPLLIFIHGSGNIDRKGNQGPALQLGYLEALSDSLNQKGIATYRFDKRTSSIENLKKMSRIRISDYVEDVRLAVKHFEKDKRFSGIHLLGHSQGSLVGLLVKEKEVKSYTSLAGAAKRIDTIIINQIGGQLPALKPVARQHFQELHDTDTILKVNPMLAQVFAGPNQKFLKDWAAYDPQKEIKECGIPILIIQGLADIQVPLEQGLDLAASADPYFESLPAFIDLRDEQSDAPQKTVELKSKNAAIGIAVIPKLNHLGKEVNSLAENQQAYGDASVPLSNELIRVLAEFLTKSDG